jgi:hypothetical protein
MQFFCQLLELSRPLICKRQIQAVDLQESTKSDRLSPSLIEEPSNKVTIVFVTAERGTIWCASFPHELQQRCHTLQAIERRDVEKLRRLSPQLRSGCFRKKMESIFSFNQLFFFASFADITMIKRLAIEAKMKQFQLWRMGQNS